MNVLVLIAGVQDPKWPIRLASQDPAQLPADQQVLSPFDEAALEVALRLRDADPAVAIKALVAGGSGSLKIARAIAALNIADVSLVRLGQPWDQLATARALASVSLRQDLVLIGREFGDFDDGLVPPTLAAALGLAFFARAQTVTTSAGIVFTREAETSLESLRLSGPALVSVTNDRRTRLRKPLMKNVMQARQAAIDEIEARSEPAPLLRVERITEGSAGRKTGNCQLIGGDPVQQARTVAAMLWEART